MVLKIGLTGGIASGKTTVANFFSTLGVPVIDADAIAHETTKPHTVALKKITEHFGQSILQADGTLNREKLRKIIFKDAAQKRWLENILHPLIIKIMATQVYALDAPYCILVIPLLVESRARKYPRTTPTETIEAWVDRVLVVDAPETLQRERAKQRNLSEQQIQDILHSQCSQEERLKLANDVLQNDGDIDKLQRQVEKLHAQYLSLSQAHLSQTS